ncbi:MAG: bifunctional nitrate reductase/sulfite reductase flavoprotein subunit alpha [Sphingomonadales bacterium]|nr:bifunctional nitrate reductase/sulfite reductase flavoprotein subunit alpha [Sphingomonadales bacterium]MDE2171393.1 bifunctional nitrate reductase/sulfite reductase flavoprotein subunit alpha [Sphingomonadales bacterium]
MTTRKVKSVCPYCGVGCGIVMETRDDRIVKVSGDKSHPANFGRLCTKGSTCHTPVSAPGRADKAYVRLKDGSDQGAVPMTEAIRQTADGLRAIIDRDGPDAVSLYVSGQMSLEAQYLANKLCKGFIGTNNIESNSRLCMASAASGYKLSLGADGPPGSYQDFDHADLFFVIGANMADCHPILFLRMMDRVKAGARLIVVDPRRNATAEKADLFLQVKPGTDLALLNGLLHLLVEQGHTDTDFIAAHTQGWEAMSDFLADYPPASVAALTGLAEEDLCRAAAMIGKAANWMSCWTMGLNQSTHGTWNTNAICNLHLATGAILRPGSGPFSLTGQPNAMGGREMGYMGPGLPGQRATLSEADRAFVEDIWAVPRGTLKEKAGTPSGGGTMALFRDMAAGSVKACWIICTNPVASVANRQVVIDALNTAELVIAQDAFLDTETNRHAHIILPGALWAEAEGVMINSERNMTLMQAAVPPPGEAMADWQIIAKVACAMGYEEAFSYASAAEVFDEIARFWNPKTGYDIRGASHARLRETPLQWPCPPEGADRNPIRYRNDGISQTLRVEEDGTAPAITFPTDSGKAIFLPRPHMDPAEMPDAEHPLILNTGRLQHQWHTLTKTAKVATLGKLNPGPFVEINPEDAQALGIAEKDQVEIRSRRGRAVLPAVVTDRVQPGSCFAPFHWNDVFGDHLAVNAVTSDAVDPVSLQPEFKFSAVAVTRVSGPAAVVEPAKAATSNASRSVDTLCTFLDLPAVPPALSPDEHTYMAGFAAGLRLQGVAADSLPVLPESAPFTPERRLTINGLLAGMFARLPVPVANAVPESGHKVLILWASQTGRAEEAASRSTGLLAAQGIKARLCAMTDATPADLAGATHLLVLASTFGDGEAPDNGQSFWQALSREDALRLDHLAFAVLGFGDSSYDSFCGFGRAVDARLEALGGRRMLDRVDCEPDDEAPEEGWARRIAALLGDAAPAAAPVPAPLRHDRKNPLTTSLITNRLLSGPHSQKEVRQFGFDLAGHEFAYQAGDALGVWPINCPDLVGDILARLDLHPEAPVAVSGHGELALGEALLHHLDITRTTRAFLDLLASHDPEAGFAPLLAPEHKDDLSAWLWGRQMVDALCAATLSLRPQDLVDALKPLQPRLYSISSSPLVQPDEVQLTVSVVRWQQERALRKGVCSSFLADRATAHRPRIFLQPSPHFRPPAEASRDCIMIGPGTGIAPFRAFLQDREATGAAGRNWLFFGEQHEGSDFYYRDQISRWAAQGHLAHLSLAFSRDQAEKIYVQHRMLEQGADLWNWLEGGAHLYVCGDASRMARDVDAALLRIVADHGGMDHARAADYVSAMQKDKRYVRDVY